MNSGNIYLGSLREEDRETLRDWINDRETVIHNASYQPVHPHAHQNWFATIQSRKDLVIFGIRTKAENRLIGTCQLHSIHPVHRSAELQIRIGDPHDRGKGFGSEAIRLLLAFGFRDLNLHRIYLHVFAENIPAIRTYTKCGFLQEGLLRQAVFINGSYRDVLVMGLLTDEFQTSDQ